MQNTLEIGNVESYFYTKNVKYLAVEFDEEPPENWEITAYSYGAWNSTVIDGVAWHQFQTWKKALDFTLKFQGLFTPYGVLEVFALDLPSDTTFDELVEVVQGLSTVRPT